MIIKKSRIKDNVPYECKSITGEGWRLVHNGKEVIAKIKGTKTSKTSTKWDVLEHATELEVNTKIKELKLKEEVLK
jgi:hypothetical protein